MDNLRLYAIVFRLAAIRPGAVPADHGDQARAALFELIRHGDLPLAQRLHDQNMLFIKPCVATRSSRSR